MKIRQIRVNISQIIEILEAIKLYSDMPNNWKKIRSQIGWSDDIFWHAKPACERLHLITGQYKNRRLELTHDGETLLEAYQKSNTDFLDTFGKLLLYWDKREKKVVHTLLKLYNVKGPDSYPGCPIALRELVSELNEIGIKITIDVLIDLLELYKETGIVKLKLSQDSLKNYVQLNIQRYQKLESKKLYPSPKDISNDTFFDYLYDSYTSLLSRFHGSKYVPIPQLRKKVCSKRYLNIPENVFDEKLIRLPFSIKGMRIAFSPPMEKRTNGVLKGKDYYYYLAIFE